MIQEKRTRRNKINKMKCKLTIHKEKIHKEFTSSCQVKRRGERIRLTTYLKIIICLVHLIMQVQTQPTESSLTSLQLTFQHLNISDYDINSIEPIMIKYRINMDHDIQGDEELSQNDELWDTAQNNEWYRWAAITVRETGKENCLLCSKSPLNKVISIPSPYDYQKCAEFGRNFCHLTDFTRPCCLAECLGFLGNPKLTDYFFRPLWGSWCQYSDVSQNIIIEKRKVEIPKWYSIDYKQEYVCFHSKFKGKCVVIC